MRLIKEEDVLAKMYFDDSWSSGGEHMKVIDEDTLEEIPEVEAIPVEYLRKVAKILKEELPEGFMYAAGIETAIQLWEQGDSLDEVDTNK